MLDLVEVPPPVPPADGYVVALAAIGINFADVVERRGRYRAGQCLPYELGKEGAGVIVARGPRARDHALGEPVIVVRFAGGCYAEQVAVSPHELLRGPAGYDLAELAAFANGFATAWYGLTEVLRVRAGESFLVSAAAGAVGSATVQLARALGLDPVLGLAGGPEKCRFVEAELGADRCFDYREGEVEAQVRAHRGGAGIELALDTVGGEALEAMLALLEPLGRLASVGFSSIDADYGERLPRLSLLRLFHRSISIGGLNLERLDYPRRQESWRRLVAFAEEKGLKPHVGHLFPLAEVAEAHRALECRATVGKVLLIP
ncbi:MAG TPA: zinc-binding dehydrogenase [Thermoanaerobaculia bacterium]|nr:zinc-binding dehydrogenase [Thermoanaerobaculia bacterium]